MNILVVDVESTCWKFNPPPGEVSEIIEIGAVVVDNIHLKAYNKTSLLCRPANSKVSNFCTELTTITPEMVKDAPSLDEQVKKLLKVPMVGSGTTWGSWGDYDRKMFERHAARGDIAYPFTGTHINIKNMFSVLTGNRASGVSEALDRLKLPLEGTYHRGADDAWNIAKILMELINNYRLGA